MIVFRILLKDKDINVAIMSNENDNKYSFVNLTDGFIGSKKFDSVELAIDNLKLQQNLGDIIGYVELK